MNLQAIGQRIRTLREINNLSREALAQKVGVHPTTIGNIERGDHELQLGQLLGLADAFGVKPEVLLRAARKPKAGRVA